MLSGRCCRKELVKEESQIPSNRSVTKPKNPGAGHSQQMVGLPVGKERNEEFTDMMLPIVNSRTVRMTSVQVTWSKVIKERNHQ